MVNLDGPSGMPHADLITPIYKNTPMRDESNSLIIVRVRGEDSYI